MKESVKAQYGVNLRSWCESEDEVEVKVNGQGLQEEEISTQYLIL